MASSSEKNAEIWSTRLQRELLALTGGLDDGAEGEKETAGALPGFVAVKEHKLDIEAGQCRVDFIVKTKGDDEEGIIVIALDVSLPKAQDGSIDREAPCYPFEKPAAIVLSGSSLFADGSTVTDGCIISIDVDWTPSLHLNDAIQNVGLKIRESIQQNEPIHPRDPAEGVVEKGLVEVGKGAGRISGFLSKTAKGLSVSYAPDGEPKRKLKRKSKKKKAVSANDINMGDEINLLEAPWVDARGVYSCKAIRRPGFVEDAMTFAAEAELNKDKKETSGAGFGAGMLRSITQSAKSVLEESFLMVTDTHVIELKSNKLNLSTGTVTFAITIDMLAKLKFRRQESISLFFKPSPDDPLIFMCPDSGDCVHQIQTVLKRHGVKGKHTNVATQRAINEAMQLVEEIKAKEKSLDSYPTVERVNEIMDLYRQAAERFEVAGDVRHSEVVVHMRKFLALPLTASILDGTYVEAPKVAEPSPTVVAIPPATTGPPKPVPEGEVLERTESQLEDDGSGEGASIDSDKELNDNIDNILKEAKADLPDLDDEDLSGYEDGLGEDLADLDAMFDAADKELSDLMSS
mmetsp:Transcript_29061/g.40846  ORF Transcript_29061/g.40846 Transcript_29061/m.40846 type:complete len:574 (-) Transcript_29061:40-1761(-)